MSKSLDGTQHHMQLLSTALYSITAGHNHRKCLIARAINTFTIIRNVRNSKTDV